MSGCSLSAHTDKAGGIYDAQGESTLRVSMSTETDNVTLGDAIPLHLSLHNTGDSPAPFLPINTAFEAMLTADVFSVTLNDEPQPYLGFIASRLPPTLEDVSMIGPNERVEQTVDIASYYKMDRVGEYFIQYVPNPLVIGEELDVELTTVVVETDQISITVR